jgi:putative flippase GtrA
MNANTIPSPRIRMAKYGAVMLVGLGIDFGVTLTLWHMGGLRLEFSAAGGYLVALVSNYVLFEFWVFYSETSVFSALRLTQTVLVTGVALSARVGVIWLVQRVLGSATREAMAAILLGYMSSVVINYLLLQLVFARQRMARQRRSRSLLH